MFFFQSLLFNLVCKLDFGRGWEIGKLFRLGKVGVCVYVCVYVCVCVCVCACACACMRAHTWICASVFTRRREIKASMSVCVRVRVHLYSSSMCVCLY
jgi:hypothetical protein